MKQAIGQNLTNKRKNFVKADREESKSRSQKKLIIVCLNCGVNSVSSNCYINVRTECPNRVSTRNAEVKHIRVHKRYEHF